MLLFVLIHAPAKEKHIVDALTKSPKELCTRFDVMSLPEVDKDMQSQSDGVQQLVSGVNLNQLSTIVKDLAAAKTVLEERSVGQFDYLKPSLEPMQTKIERAHKAGLTMSAVITCLTCLRHKNLMAVKADDGSSTVSDADLINNCPKTTFLLKHLFCTLNGVAQHSLEIPWQIVKETEYYKTRFGHIVPDLSEGTAKGSTAASRKSESS
jgi:hypothetical protein